MNRLIMMIAGIELILVAAAAAEDSVYSCPHRPTAVCAVVTDQYQPLGRATGTREMTPAAFDEDLLSPFLADEPWPADEPAWEAAAPEPWDDGWGRWWGEVNYRMLWTNGNPVPPLISTNSTVPPRAEAGVLDVGDTRVLLGDQRLDIGGRSGAALTVGHWLDAERLWGLQANWFYTGSPSDARDDRWSSPGEPVLARPFIRAATGAEDAQLVAYPEVVHGGVNVATRSDLRSFEALLRRRWRSGTSGQVDLLGGYRYFAFHEGLRLEEDLVLVDPGGLAPIGTTVGLFDHFQTENDFHGAQFGLATGFWYGVLDVDVVTKLGLGSVSREWVIDGATHVMTPTGGDPIRPADCWPCPRTWEPRATVRSRCCPNWT